MFANIESAIATCKKLAGRSTGRHYSLDSLIIALYVSISQMSLVVGERPQETLRRWESEFLINARHSIKRLLGKLMLTEAITLDLSRQILTTRQALFDNLYSTTLYVLNAQDKQVSKASDNELLANLISSALSKHIGELPNYETIPFTFYRRLGDSLREEMTSDGFFSGEEQARFALYHDEIKETAFGVARSFFYIAAKNCTVDRPFIKIEDSCEYAIQAVLNDYIADKATLKIVAHTLSGPLFVRSEELITPTEEKLEEETKDSEPTLKYMSY